MEAKAKEVAVAKLLTDLKNKKSEATWFVYLMRCADYSLYTGITNDLPRRLEGCDYITFRLSKHRCFQKSTSKIW